MGSSLDFERTEDGIDDGSLDLDGINEGNFGSLLDSDGTTDDGSLNFDGTADGNVEGSLDFDGTGDGIVIAVFDKNVTVIRTFTNSKPSRQLNYCPKEQAVIRTFGTGY